MLELKDDVRTGKLADISIDTAIATTSIDSAQTGIFEDQSVEAQVLPLVLAECSKVDTVISY